MSLVWCLKFRMDMRWLFKTLILLAAVGELTISGPAAESAGRILLAEGWEIQSSAKIKAGGEAISTTEFKTEDWHKATVPSTVVGCLVEDKVYPDPFFGMNMRSMPGMSYPIGANFSLRKMPVDSPFRN